MAEQRFEAAGQTDMLATIRCSIIPTCLLLAVILFGVCVFSEPLSFDVVCVVPTAGSAPSVVCRMPHEVCPPCVGWRRQHAVSPLNNVLLCRLRLCLRRRTTPDFCCLLNTCLLQFAVMLFGVCGLVGPTAVSYECRRKTTNTRDVFVEYYKPEPSSMRTNTRLYLVGLLWLQIFALILINKGTDKPCKKPTCTRFYLVFHNCDKEKICSYDNDKELHGS